MGVESRLGADRDEHGIVKPIHEILFVARPKLVRRMAAAGGPLLKQDAAS
jgi:hypothetical protein